jgi:hypothetical protein
LKEDPGFNQQMTQDISTGCEQLHTEVFRTSDIDRTIALADRFFSLMPPVGLGDDDVADQEHESALSNTAAECSQG